MELKSVCLIIDVRIKPCLNGKSTLQNIKDALLPVFSRFPESDFLYLYELDGVIQYQELGSIIAAISNYSPHNFILPVVLEQMMQIVYNINVEDEIFVLIITDKCNENIRVALKLFMDRENIYNIYDKSIQYSFISSCSLPNSHIIQDFSEITPEIIECSIFKDD